MLRGDSCAGWPWPQLHWFLNRYNELPRQSTHRKQYLTSIAKKFFTGEMMSLSPGTFFALNYWIFWSFSWYWCEWSVCVMKWYECWCFSMLSTYMHTLFCILEVFLYTEVYLRNCLIKSLLHSVSILYGFSKLSLYIWKNMSNHFIAPQEAHFCPCSGESIRAHSSPGVPKQSFTWSAVSSSRLLSSGEGWSSWSRSSKGNRDGYGIGASLLHKKVEEAGPVHPQEKT